jgi:amino acid transporter
VSDAPEDEDRGVHEGRSWVSVPKEKQRPLAGNWLWLVLLASVAVFVAFGVVAYAVLTYAYPSEVPRPRGEGVAQLVLAVAGFVPIVAMVRSAAKDATRPFWLSVVSAVVIYLLWVKLNADARHAM